MAICCPILLIPLAIITVCILKQKENILLEKGDYWPFEHHKKRKSSLQSQNNGHLLQTTLKWLHCNQCIIVQGSWQYAAPQVFQLTDHMDEHSSIGQPKITYFHFASEIIGIHCHKEQIKQELECLYLHFNSVHHQNKISSKQNSTVAIGNRERANSH